jgi:GAF domain-containing protein
VVLHDAPTDDHYGDDPYIARSRPRSVMCVAVQNQGRQVGVLYLENRVLAGAFTSDRIRIMQMLAADAAIALEKARLIDGACGARSASAAPPSTASAGPSPRSSVSWTIWRPRTSTFAAT